MTWIYVLLSRCTTLFRGKKLDADLDEELRAHIDLAIAENRRNGMSAEQAGIAALRAFGGITQIRETYRIERGLPLLELVAWDVRYALRQFLKSPGFAATAILTLALGIGANTAIFSVVDGVLLNPLPFPHADRLVWVWGRIASGAQVAVSGPDFQDYRAQNQSFQTLSAFSRTGTSVWSVNGSTKLLEGAIATADFFETLGASPILGRGILRADEQNRQAQVVVLSYSVWRQEYGGRADVIGQRVRIDGDYFTIVGVMPRSFNFPTNIGFWCPAPMRSDYMLRRASHGLSLLGLLKPGISLVQAQKDMDAIAGRLAASYPASDKGWSLGLQPMKDAIVGSTRSVLLILLVSVGMVLLIACINITNLLLARNAARQKEVAIRLAIGAGRLRLLQQLMTESLVLSLLAGALACVFGYLGVELVRRFGPADLPRLNEVHLSLPVLAYTALISMITAFFFGLLPAWLGTKTLPQAALRDDGRTGIGRNRHTLGSVLIVSETTLSVCLLIAAALLLQSLWKTLRTSPGFSSRNTLTAQLLLPNSYDDDTKRIAFERQLADTVRALPGVQTVGAIEETPLRNEGNDDTFFQIVGQPPRDPHNKPDEDYRVATPTYFPAMGITLLRGRLFTEDDRQSAPPVVVIDEPFARKYFPNADPIGRRLKLYEGTPGYVDCEIIGEVSGVRHYGLRIPPRPTVYYPYAQVKTGGLDLVIRSSGDPQSLSEPIRRIVSALDSQVGLSAFVTMDDVVSQSVSGDRFNAILIGMFAGLALVLAMAGVYGVFSYIVAQQTRDIGVRMALGARPIEILKMTLGRGVRLAAFGAALGIVTALLTMRSLASQLYEIEPFDPATYLGVTLLLIAVAMVACYLPARRAASIDPMKALRAE